MGGLLAEVLGEADQQRYVYECVCVYSYTETICLEVFKCEFLGIQRPLCRNWTPPGVFEPAELLPSPGRSPMDGRAGGEGGLAQVPSLGDNGHSCLDFRPWATYLPFEGVGISKCVCMAGAKWNERCPQLTPPAHTLGFLSIKGYIGASLTVFWKVDGCPAALPSPLGVPLRTPDPLEEPPHWVLWAVGPRALGFCSGFMCAATGARPARPGPCAGASGFSGARTAHRCAGCTAAAVLQGRAASPHAMRKLCESGRRCAGRTHLVHGTAQHSGLGNTCLVGLQFC